MSGIFLSGKPMTNKIKTYQDLLQYEAKLEMLLKAQKELLAQDIELLHEEIKPATNALSFISRVTTSDNGNFFLNQRANKLIDFIVKKLILGKAGWLTRLTIPFFLKNYSSHFIAEHKGEFMAKLFSWIGHKNGKAKAAPVAPDPEKETNESR